MSAFLKFYNLIVCRRFRRLTITSIVATILQDNLADRNIKLINLEITAEEVLKKIRKEGNSANKWQQSMIETIFPTAKKKTKQNSSR